MSSSALPITPQRFAEAILDLPLPTLHFKASEIRNSISHLEASNAQLQDFADQGDNDCGDAVQENKDTILRMEERKLMLRREVERRGFQWGDDSAIENRNAEQRSNGHVEIPGGIGVAVEAPDPSGENVAILRRQNSAGRSMRDAALARENSHEEADDGVHL